MTETGLIATQQWQWPYVLSSFVVAVVGSGTSLLIMKQRTAAAGLRNHLYLLAGAIVFGAVGVFSMHFVGMEALHLYRPDTGQELIIAYLPLPTACSLIVVILIAVVAFGVAGDPLKQEWWRYAVAGIAGAGGVLVMHYLGMLAMCTQAEIVFSVSWVAASVVIGWVAVTAALLIFFRFRKHWQHHCPVLAGCALLLGGAVCGVHYTGMQSATYHVVDSPPSVGSLPSPNVLLAVTLALASFACLVALALLTLKYRHLLRTEKSKRTSLIINAIVLNANSLVLTTVTLSLPSVVVEQAYKGQETFDHRNMDFIRMVKASTQWSRCSEYTTFLEGLHARDVLNSYSLSLHIKFLKAAKELAGMCRLELSNLGLLYWAPTGSMVTVVMRVDERVAQRITKTSDLRFLPASTVFPFISSIVGTPEPHQWMELMTDYHEKTNLNTGSSMPDSPISGRNGEKREKRLSWKTGSSQVAPLSSFTEPGPRQRRE